MATATQLPQARAVFYDANGNPLCAGIVSTYVAGTTTPAATWQDAAETTANTNPIVLDSGGSCLLYGSGSYQLTVTDALGNAIPAYSGVTTGAVVIPPAPTYLGAGAGAVTRTIVSKLSDVVSVADFGCDMTGATDSTAGFQAALNYAVSVNGTVYVPVGTLQISGVTITAIYKNLTIMGAGRGATNISCNSVMATVLNLSLGQLEIRDLTITASVNKTGGWHLKTTSNVCVLTNLGFDKFWIGIGGYDQDGLWTNIIFTNPMLNSMGMVLNGYNVQMVMINVIFYTGLYQPTAGIWIQNGGGFLLYSVLINIYGTDLWIAPGNGQMVASVQVFGGAFDAATTGVFIAPTGTGSVVRCKFVGVEFNSNVNNGVSIQNMGVGLLQGVEFSDCMFSLNGGSGLSLITGAGSVTGVTVSGGNMCQNVGAGILVGANVTDFTITGVQAGAYAGMSGNGNYGITITAGTSNRYIVSSNRLTGNGSGGFVDGGTGTNKSFSDNVW